MREGHAIIGASYGDEGKGLMTDYLAADSPYETVVVRFNGGAQAGHTVVSPDGRRHVFSHFGSGALAGCPTYLSRFFIVNPILFIKEQNALQKLGVLPSVGISPDAILSTPLDMAINQMVETARGRARHGSCGLGINETVTRCLRSASLDTRAKELLFPKMLEEKLLWMGKKWLPQRLQEHKIDCTSEEARSIIRRMEDVIGRFMLDVKLMTDSVEIGPASTTRRRVIFEGAQGLMLDEHRIDQWPHVTRSRTGLANVLSLMPELGIEKLTVTYMTRSYLTRHGAGRLPGEMPMSFPDDTNIVNEFQGRLRFAPLDWRELEYSIDLDLRQAAYAGINVTPNLGITCADQLPPSVPSAFFLPIAYVSNGPTRNDVAAACDLTPTVVAALHAAV